MAFTRLDYDKKTYEREVIESTGPGKYQLVPQSTHLGNETCFQETPEIHADVGQYKISAKNDMVDVESDLYNLIRKDTKDPQGQYPYVKKDYGNKPIIPSCKKTDLARVYPLLDGNQFNREKQIQVPRFESLCLNPQQLNRIRSNNYIGLNTRLFNRDKNKPNIPKLKNNHGLPPVEESNKYISPIKAHLKHKRYMELLNEAEEMTNVKNGKKKIKENFCGSCSMN
jgi:hypothetical protein